MRINTPLEFKVKAPYAAEEACTSTDSPLLRSLSNDSPQDKLQGIASTDFHNIITCQCGYIRLNQLI